MNAAVFLSVAFVAVIFGLEQSVSVPVCPATSSNLNQCVRKALQQIIPSLAAGIHSIGADATDPLSNLPGFKHSHSSGFVPFHIQTESNVVNGLNSVVVNDVQVDLRSNQIHIQSTIPGELVASGIHKSEADIMGIPIRGRGPYKVTLAGAGLNLTLQGEATQHPDGQIYLHLNSAKADLKIGSPTAEVEGFFSSFPPLERAASAFANSMAARLVADMKPSLENWLEEIALKRAQSVFKTVSYDALFPGRSPSIFDRFETSNGYN